MNAVIVTTTGDYVNLGMQLMTSVQNTNPLLFGISVLLAVMSAFFGYKVLRAWISVAGFIIGLLLGSGAAALCGLDGRVSILVGLVVGVVLALIAFALYKIGVFFYAAFCTMSCVMNLLNCILQATSTAWWVVLIAFVAGAAVGYFAMRNVRYSIIATSSISGGVSLATLLLPLFRVTSLPVILVTAAVIAVIGAIWQLRTTEPEKKPEEKKDAKDKKKDASKEGKKDAPTSGDGATGAGAVPTEDVYGIRSDGAASQEKEWIPMENTKK